MLKYKGYSLINIIGLSIGLTICFLLSLWINDELSYDQFHENSNRIYRMQWEAKYGDNSWKMPLVPMPLAGMMEREFPEVEKATQVFKGRFTVQKGEEHIRENKVLYIDEKFFEVFTVQTIAGKTQQAISNPDAILLTEESAARYFGERNNYQDVIGKTIKRNDGVLMQVAGVVKSFPVQSHLTFDFLASLKNLKHLENRKTHWGSATLFTYFLLSDSGDPVALADKVEDYNIKNIQDEEFLESGNYSRFPFEIITDIHLQPKLSYLWIFGIIAAIILLLACINFINLTTARAMTRAKEVGIRKVLGSKRGQLVKQFFSESTLYVISAVGLACFLAEFTLPFFNELTDKQLDIQWFSSSFVWGLLFLLLITTAVLTGAFPAFVLSSFSPAKVIKGQLTKSGRKDRFRQGLVIFQFCISSILIISSLVVKDQLHFLLNKDIGFDKEQVVIIKRARALGNNYTPFLEKLKSNAIVEKVSIAQFLPGDGFDSTIFVPEQPSNYKETSLTYSHVDEHFVDALKLEMSAGRNFDLSFSTDSTSYLLNEKAVEKLGWENAIGKKISYGGFIEGPVVGVVKDYNFSSLHEEISPIVLCMTSSRLSNIIIRLQPGNLQEQVQLVQSEWKAMAPTAPFEFAFLDEEIEQLYKSEERMSATFAVFVLLTIFIGSLGLFGLAAFMAEQRTKEIGIRKVLGASVAGIVGLLSKDFLKLVFIALIIASPLAYYLMEKWLQDFAYRIDVHWSVFVLTALIIIAVAFLTVSFQSVKAALANPVESLKTE